ncbi:hypothetical protein SK128_021633, partial [Halocaridina rubra]
IIVLNGCKDEVWPYLYELRSVAGHGCVVCLPAHTVEQHYSFSKHLLEKAKFLKETPNIQEEITDFIANFHLTYCAKNDDTSDRIAQSVHRISRGSTFGTPKYIMNPSVASMETLVEIFRKLHGVRRAKILSKLQALQKAMEHVAHLDKHVKNLRTTHSTLEKSFSDSDISINDIAQKLKEREANIEDLDKEVSELRVEIASVERAYEELRGEVTEYVEETKAPLLEITASLSQLDMQRIRKLL